MEDDKFKNESEEIFYNKMQDLKNSNNNPYEIIMLSFLEMIEHLSREHANDDRAFRDNVIKMTSLQRAIIARIPKF